MKIANFENNHIRLLPDRIFFLPGKYNSNNVPDPIDPRVRVVMVPEQFFAVLRFSGSASDEAVANKKLELLQLLET